VDAEVGGFGFFEFALVGVPLLAGTMAIIIFFGRQSPTGSGNWPKGLMPPTKGDAIDAGPGVRSGGRFEVRTRRVSCPAASTRSLAS
jgi:hypothetical protein